MLPETPLPPKSETTSSVRRDDTITPSLTRIEHKLDELDDRLTRIQTQTKPKESNPAHSGANKLAVAAAFSIAGLKLGAFFLGKLGFLLIDHPRAYKRGGMQAVRELYSNIVTLGGGKTVEHLGDDYKYMATGLATGTVIGPAIGASIGIMRGDRLDKPSDLFAHPIDSMGKIFGPSPKKAVHHERAIAVPVQASPQQKVESSRVYNGTVAETSEHSVV